LRDLVAYVEEEAKVEGVAWNAERVILTTKKGGRELLDCGEWGPDAADIATVIADFHYLFGVVE
jgi:hypothetical protein